MELDVNQAIEQIAEKLGVAVNELYPALYKQTIIGEVINGVWVLVFVSIIVGFLVGVRYIVKKQKEHEHYSDWDWDEPGPMLFMIIGIVMTIIGLIVIAVNINNGITALFNPDFYILKWALSQITG